MCKSLAHIVARPPQTQKNVSKKPISAFLLRSSTHCQNQPFPLTRSIIMAPSATDATAGSSDQDNGIPPLQVYGIRDIPKSDHVEPQSSGWKQGTPIVLDLGMLRNLTQIIGLF